MAIDQMPTTGGRAEEEEEQQLQQDGVGDAGGGGGPDDASIGSAEEALLEMLGLLNPTGGGGAEALLSGGMFVEESEEEDIHGKKDGRKNGASTSATLEDLVTSIQGQEGELWLRQVCDEHNLRELYEAESVCVFPSELSVPAHIMRRLTDELVWGGEKVKADRTTETVKVVNKSSGGETVSERRVLTRLENFVDGHGGWDRLCRVYLQKLVSAALGEPHCLYKEKLNLKPPGGSGFAPHLDTPSLRAAWATSSVPVLTTIAEGDDDEEEDGGNDPCDNDQGGPRNFVTVMVAIDDMTVDNGCLRIVKGPWNEHSHCEVVAPGVGENPDAGGRAGAIPSNEITDDFTYEPICCKGGTVVAFGGYAPHRSSANASHFPRRAVFLTYNPASEGDYHHEYYDRMAKLRNDWKSKVGLNRSNLTPDELDELDALATIPRI